MIISAAYWLLILCRYLLSWNVTICSIMKFINVYTWYSYTLSYYGTGFYNKSAEMINVMLPVSLYANVHFQGKLELTRWEREMDVYYGETQRWRGLDENGAKRGFHQFSSVQFILFHHGNSHQPEAVLQCSMQTEVRNVTKGKHDKQKSRACREACRVEDWGIG